MTINAKKELLQHKSEMLHDMRTTYCKMLEKDNKVDSRSIYILFLYLTGGIFMFYFYFFMFYFPHPLYFPC